MLSFVKMREVYAECCIFIVMLSTLMLRVVA